ncbi:MAG: TOMM precursor leader peptide-binding protein [Rhodospirillales bacterium]
MGQLQPLGFGAQFSAHRVADDQVLLLSEKRSFRLRGQLYADLMPLLDGEHSEAEIVAAAATDAAGAERVKQALAHLRKKGYLRERLPTPVAQQSLWLEWEKEPEEVAAALAAWPLALQDLGSGPSTGSGSVADMAASLLDAGFPLVPRDDARLLLILVDDFLSPAIVEVSRAAREKDQAFILFKPGGREAWLGPRFDPDGARCWRCLSRWLAEYRPGDSLVTPSGKATRPARGLLRATQDFARSQATLALIRMALGNKELDAHLLSFDSFTAARQEHYVRLDPACPVCADGAHGHDGTGRVAEVSLKSLGATGSLASKEGGWRVLTGEEAHARLKPLVSPITGIVPALEDRSERYGLPVVTAMQTMPQALALSDNRLVGRPGAAGGKGATLIQAEVSCMAEALERYCSGYTGREPRRRARLAELGDTALDPNRLLLYSERQYRTRESWNPGQACFNRVPLPFDPEEAIEWSPIHRLRDGALCWVPTRYSYYDYRDRELPRGRHFCSADSNGCASGAVLGEAVLQGLLELIERDAFAIFWYNRIARPQFDLDAFDDPFLQKTRSRYRAEGRCLYALDLRGDLGIPVVAAICCNADGGQIQIGLGAHPDHRVALARAVAEVNQVAALDLGIPSSGEQESDGGLRDWMSQATLESDPYLLPLAGAKRQPGDFPQLCEAAIGPALEACCQALERAGLDVLVMDQSWPGLDFACARVVVPGLRHFWARFAPGRLYDVPVKLGWLEQPTAEESLNPIPFFL